MNDIHMYVDLGCIIILQCTIPCDWTASVIFTWVIRSDSHMCLHLGHCGCVFTSCIPEDVPKS